MNHPTTKKEYITIKKDWFYLFLIMFLLSTSVGVWVSLENSSQKKKEIKILNEQVSITNNALHDLQTDFKSLSIELDDQKKIVVENQKQIEILTKENERLQYENDALTNQNKVLTKKYRELATP